MLLRTRSYILAVLLVALVISSGGDVFSQAVQSQRRQMPLPTLKFPADKTVVEVPFEVESGLMVIPVSINGSGPFRYGFDTGASGTVHFDPSIVDALNLKIGGEIQVRGAGGGGAISTARIAENINFNIGGIELSNGRLALRGSVGGLSGVVGRPIFANLVVEVDWEKQVIRFYDPAKFNYAGPGIVLPLTFDDGGRPYTMASVAVAGEKRTPVKLVVDSGASHALSLDVGSTPEIILPEGAVKTVLGRGASGEVTGHSGRVSTVEFGGQIFKNVPTSFPDSSSGTAGLNGRHGNLGSGILRRFKVIYDYSRKQMILEPNKFTSSAFGTPMPNTPATTIQVAASTLQDYVGKYGNKEISVRESGLYYQRIGGSGAVLRATGKDKFALNTDAQVTFVRDANGVVTEMIIEWVERDKEQLKRETPARTQIQNLTPSLDIPMAVASKVGSQASGATQKSNFSGVWLLDKDKSDGLPASVDQTVTIVQDGDRVEVATKTTSERGEQNSKSSYLLDGKEIEAALSGPMPGSTVKGKQTSKWSPDGKGFESADEGTFETPNGPAIIKTSRKFQLSPDGATLVIEISREGPMTMKSKRVFAKSGGTPAGRQAGRKLSETEVVKEAETYLEQAVAEDAFSGGALIAKDGKPIFEKAYGLANKSTSTPNKVDTKFNLGSINKSFTSVAIAQLAQQGKLSFSDPISRYLPDYPNKTVAAKVTIHQLLTHTSGMGMYFNDEFMKRRASLKTLADLLPLFANDPLGFEPGEKIQYSNSGYVVLGLIIERVAKQNYFDYVRKHIFEPVGMKNTDSYELDEKVPNLAIGYTNMGPTGRPEPGSRKDSTPHLTGRGSSAGGGYSTLEDMLKFGQALIGYKLLNRQFTDIVLSNQMLQGQPAAGYGFFSVEVNGNRAIGNNGGGPGINSTFTVYPELGYTVVVMSNYDPPSASKVTSKIRDLLTSLPAALQASSAPQPGQGQSLTQAEQDVRKLEREWLDAYEKRDVEAMNRILAEDFKLTRSNGVQTKADILAELKATRDSSRPTMKFSTEDVQSRVEGETLILTGRFILRSERDGQTRTMMEARYTDTYVKRNGRWQVGASQMTRIP